MKCPYRKRTIITKYADYKDRTVSETEETFEECLADECPFYKHIYQPRCKKVDAEVGKE